MRATLIYRKEGIESMKKKLDVIFGILIPTAAGYASFFLIYYLYQKLFYEYRLLAIIPFVIVSIYFIRNNIREWREIKQNS